jgi:hypothetical protein
MTLCESIDTLAMAFLDGELATEEKHELETHLTECPSCRTEVDTARSDQELLHISLQAPRASDSMRMRIGKALEAAEKAEVIDIRRADRRRLSSWMLPGSAILAAAAAIFVFVGVGFKAPSESVGSIAKAGVHQQTRSLPLEVQGASTGPWMRQFGSMEPQLEAPGSQVLGGRYLPSGVSGHDAWLIAYDVPMNDRRIVFTMLKIDGVSADQMADGEEIEANGRAVRVIHTDGHVAVTCVDAKHYGYMFMAEELSVDELVTLVSKTGLVGKQ